MAKTKVRVLFPQAFVGAGVEVYKKDKEGNDVALETVDLEAADAEALIAQGYAEEVKATAKKASG